MTRPFAGKRYWLVGASAGLGQALAQRLSAEGATLVISARDGAALAQVAAGLPGPVQAVPVDVQDQASVEAAAQAAGPVDGVVILAALYWPMPATEWNAAQVTAMCDVNLTGAVRVLGAVLPGMLARGRGHVVLTGSLSAFRGLPGAVGYGATKAAIQSLAETMRADLQGTGIDVQLVNPGYIRTRLTAMNDFRMPFIMTPEAAAAQMLAHMRTRRFARHFPRGFSLLFRAMRLLPDALYFRIMGRG